MSLIMRMILDIFAQIFRTLWAHKLRSFLTMFGVAWGEFLVAFPQQC
jgi:putative ABC transport system permease protein